MNIKTELRKYGVSDSSVRVFGDVATPELLDYIDLIKLDSESMRPEGVVEAQGRPLLFFVDESHVSVPTTINEPGLKKLRNVLACRGERAYLARIMPGQLKVIPVTLGEKTPEWKSYDAGTGEASTLFSRLTTGTYDREIRTKNPDALFNEIFELLRHVADRLAEHIERADVLSLVGRALFFRFLQDRQVIDDSDVKQIAPSASNLALCFATPECAAATCKWLDRTFNGNFLPLTENGEALFFEGIGKRTRDSVFVDLGAIIGGERPVGSGSYQLRLNWGDFSFAHIPVGLLSQVYEKFVWKWDHRDAEETSVHYTPRNIAATLVDEAFYKFPNAHEARILDPACGAGVFLVLALRRLYQETWKHSESRPDTKAIRKILEQQLAGFEISDAALKFCALSLYLTAIELDPKPVPPEKLKFKQLQNFTLFNWRQETDPQEGAVIGSLGPDVPAVFDHHFDLVLSNPPWTSLPEEERALATEFTRVSRGVIERLGETTLASKYHNPDSAPDLPFLWKSTEWCKPGGRIAFALPARILLKQEEVPRNARNTLLKLIEVTAIINGSNLADTNVWPEMQQPFMLMFAVNRRPKPSHVLRYITPYFDKLLNSRGELRIDSKSAQVIEPEAAEREAWIWKALAVGTSLDIAVVRKLYSRATRPLDIYWKQDLKLASGNGYMIKAKSKQTDASFLHSLKDIGHGGKFRFAVEPEGLPYFVRATAARPRSPELYAEPLVLIRESPGLKRECGWALLSHEPAAFNQSFYGYSGHGHPQGELLVRYIYVLIHSLLWIHYALLTSSKFAAERRTIYKSVLDDFPIVPMEDLTEGQKRELLDLSLRLEHADTGVFVDIDSFVGGLYGLDELDLEVVRDTFEVCMPYGDARQRACKPPSNLEQERFCNRLKLLLSPFSRALGAELHIDLAAEIDHLSPFRTIFLRNRPGVTASEAYALQAEILALANATGATRIVHEVDGGLVVGVLKQYRYWTASRARLLASEILSEHSLWPEERG